MSKADMYRKPFLHSVRIPANGLYIAKIARTAKNRRDFTVHHVQVFNLDEPSIWIFWQFEF